mmetsp:Transcript_89318/g.251432  ORF Transcript_89318/g.251432 Transcript_89318/m.251432 type:complete len:208 (+) Transcript_89318:350-973(+)
MAQISGLRLRSAHAISSRPRRTNVFGCSHSFSQFFLDTEFRIWGRLVWCLPRGLQRLELEPRKGSGPTESTSHRCRKAGPKTTCWCSRLPMAPCTRSEWRSSRQGSRRHTSTSRRMMPHRAPSPVLTGCRSWVCDCVVRCKRRPSHQGRSQILLSTSTSWPYQPDQRSCPNSTIAKSFAARSRKRRALRSPRARGSLLSAKSKKSSC